MPKAENAIDKHTRKNIHQRRIIDKKLDKIKLNPYSYGEPLRGDLKGKYSVHIDTHFILIYSVDEKVHSIIIEGYGKHDKEYNI
ncbi:MAG: type II toxin-antitoxin system mRNA interferase toxin, RelE/StbE family [Candidatus Aenigmarchaeota archaeon]|nr:type II toxin-antitoxin system mRNA interferase toxin, RelE/StbE family [Candidatus Aenigmarchaeota archaeon]